MRRLVPFVELLPGGAGRSWGFLSERTGAGGAGAAGGAAGAGGAGAAGGAAGAAAAGGAVGGELLRGSGAPGEVTFLGVALSGVTVNQAELMESDEHLRSLLEQVEIAKGEQEAAEAALQRNTRTCVLQGSAEHTASREAAQKLCFTKNKLVARHYAELKRERVLNAEARADVAADAAAAAAAAAAAVPPPTLLLGTLYGHELYGSLGGV